MSPQQTVVITGGNRGLGYQTALTLAQTSAWHVLVASRNPQRNQAAITQLRAESGYEHISALTLDLASLASVRAFAKALPQQNLPPLRAIICNAGVQTSNGLRYTEDGFEMTFGVNHLGHFLLVNLLLGQLNRPARIVVVSSGTHIPEHRLARFTQVPVPRYSSAHELVYPDGPVENIAFMEGAWRYSTSKLCNVLFAYELGRRLRAHEQSPSAGPINVYALDPGLMPGTGLARDVPAIVQWIFARIIHAARPFVAGIRTPQRSGQDLARLVTDPALEHTTDTYYDGHEAVRSSAESYDVDKARQFWEDSAMLVGLQPHETILPVKPTLTTSASNAP